MYVHRSDEELIRLLQPPIPNRLEHSAPDGFFLNFRKHKGFVGFRTLTPTAKPTHSEATRRCHPIILDVFRSIEDDAAEILSE